MTEDRFEHLMEYIREKIAGDERYILVVSKYNEAKNNYLIALRTDHTVESGLEVLLTAAAQLNDKGEQENLFKKIKPVTKSNLWKR